MHTKIVIILWHATHIKSNTKQIELEREILENSQQLVSVGQSCKLQNDIYLYVCMCVSVVFFVHSGSLLQINTKIRSQQKRRQRNHQYENLPTEKESKKATKKWRYEKYSSCFRNNIVYRQILTIKQQLI